jgi:predicted RNase H-like HicB family nuclease
LKSYVFEVVVEPDEMEDGTPAFSAHCPAVESAVTWGRTREEAIERIHDVLEGLAAIAAEDGKDLATSAAVTLEKDAVVVTI